ncbi:ankyrin repeat-containing domain, PGG domain protein [Artemisia annua]|uniref:Ankyrin repeat-containing domain, PGG domain protein n=1 Tax=Artemisia annua TaxID=35608 RepID=A0A2U1LBJ4_ARTAN|nr:ankyrin repeat-containing domain, PGG domain protein [Artemisia annua]
MSEIVDGAVHNGPRDPLQAKTKFALTDLIHGPKKDYLEIGVPLYEASIKCDWEAAKKILLAIPELVRYSITENGETALHIAASAKGPKHVEQFVKNLVDKMTKEDLEIVNKNHNTALYLAAAAGNVETVKIMVEKNKTLLTIPGAGGAMMPVYAASLFGNYEVVKYLYDNSHGLHDDGWTDTNRGWLLEKCVESDMFDIALDIVKKFPHIGRVSNVLGVLARKPEAFREKESNIIERTIKSVSAFIHSKMGTPEKESEALQLLRTVWEDIVQMDKNDIDRILRGAPDPIIMSESGSVIHTARLYKHLNKLQVETQNITKDENQVSKLKNLVSEHALDMHDEIQLLIKENKMASGMGNQVLELQKLISEYIVKIHDETKNLFTQKAGTPDQAHKLHELINQRIAVMRRAIENPKRIFSSRVLFVAAEVGNTTFLVELIRLYPDLIWKINDNGLSIFHVAVKHRHAGIYNLLYEIGAMKDMITPLRDENGNNMLHLVGQTVNRKQLENVSGGALEMQKELLWFEEVKSMIPPSYRERRNSDDLTPHELFSKEHKDMVTQGEKWMKDIASQCMVVAALIATMVFAAAFTVPGGYDQNNGIPIFHSETTFKVFVVADAISLFSSSASILYMFLSVFTSRYAERDFLVSLPKKLIVGLSYLFLSMTTMIIAFSVSFFVLYKRGLLWIPVLISVFALIPFGIYVKAQFILLSDVIRSTYGSRYLFKPRKHVLYYENPTV